jgi:hypothetical protein
MLHRIINWITNPFKKKTEEYFEQTEKYEPEKSFPSFKVPEHQPLSQEQINEIKVGLIEAVKEFREKADLDVLPVSRVSDEAKEEIINLVKEDLRGKDGKESPAPTPKQPSTQTKKKSSSKKKPANNGKKTVYGK